METLESLVARARQTMAQGYAPYSGFRVGAALEAEDGAVFVGCNVENASYGLTICAERAAVTAAVAAGHTSFRRIAIASDGEEPVPPCGACRQVLAEFAPHLEIVSAAQERTRCWSLDELLPAPFRLDAEQESG